MWWRKSLCHVGQFGKPQSSARRGVSPRSYTGGAASKWVSLQAATLSCLFMKYREETCPTHESGQGRRGVRALFQHSHISWYNVTFPTDYHSGLFAKGKPGEEVFLGDNGEVN